MEFKSHIVQIKLSSLTGITTLTATFKSHIVQIKRIERALEM